MSTDIGQVMRVLDRYIETADDNDETVRSIAAAADHVRTDPEFHEALAPLLAEEPSREALGDFKIWMSRTARTVYGIGPSSAAALTDVLLAAILLERSSLGGINSRELRNQPDPRDIAAVRRLWPRAGTGHQVQELHRESEARNPVPASSSGLEMTPSVQRILRALLAEPSQEIDGLQICTQAKLPAGSIHPILARLERLGLLKSRWEDTEHLAGAHRRRLYRFSEDGAETARLALAHATASDRRIPALRPRPAGGPA